MSSPAAADGRPQVLAIDDDNLILRYLKIALDRAGYRPVTMEDPAEVLDQIRRDPPALILLDVRLPGIDGFDLYTKIQTVSSSPVVFLSASSRSEDKQRALRMGASAFVVKPFSPPELIKTIQRVLDD